MFKRIDPPAELKSIVECYWIAENADTTRVEEKIIPDGFPEIIFHYGDPFYIRLSDRWEEQSKFLIAGQLTKFFFLENSGATGVFGVKLKPTTITRLFGIQAETLTDKVLDLASFPNIDIRFPGDATMANRNHDFMVQTLNDYFLTRIVTRKPGTAEKAVETIAVAKGMLSINELTSTVFVSERQLERIFKNFVGVSPKLYSRIIRFSHIFQCIQKEDHTWMDVVHGSGYYDQSHFIRNFKSFTGEEPSSYLFGEKNLANFFMKKKPGQ